MIRGLNLIGVITDVTFRHAAVVDHPLQRLRGSLDPQYRFRPAPDLHALTNLSTLDPQQHRNFSPCAAEIFYRDGHQKAAALQRTQEYGSNAEIRQPTVLIHPIIEEPLQIAL